MAKIILICGKIASGKTMYATRLTMANTAVLLSADEIMLTLFGAEAQDNHDDMVVRTQRYLLEKSLEILCAGMDVVLDWGFWTRAERAEVTAFFQSRGYVPEWHYLDVPQEVLWRNIRSRNRQVDAGELLFYYFDDTLASAFWGMFETPEREEIDVWVAVTA